MTLQQEHRSRSLGGDSSTANLHSNWSTCALFATPPRPISMRVVTAKSSNVHQDALSSMKRKFLPDNRENMKSCLFVQIISKLSSRPAGRRSKGWSACDGYLQFHNDIQMRLYDILGVGLSLYGWHPCFVFKINSGSISSIWSWVYSMNLTHASGHHIRDSQEP